VFVNHIIRRSRQTLDPETVPHYNIRREAGIASIYYQEALVLG
jgi:hypothetical protein